MEIGFFICRELYRNNLNGEIPKELGNLKNLISLDLYANELTGGIPKSLSKLDSLRFMYVSSQQLLC
jgi:Leucine-rich repeat (LRR) protein